MYIMRMRECVCILQNSGRCPQMRPDNPYALTYTHVRSVLPDVRQVACRLSCSFLCPVPRCVQCACPSFLFVYVLDIAMQQETVWQRLYMAMKRIFVFLLSGVRIVFKTASGARHSLPSGQFSVMSLSLSTENGPTVLSYGSWPLGWSN